MLKTIYNTDPRMAISDAVYQAVWPVKSRQMSIKVAQKLFH